MTRLAALGHLVIALIFCAALAPAASAQTFTSLLTFDGSDGQWPGIASLAQGPDGNLYGSTPSGGQSPVCTAFYGCGTIFRITPDGTLTTLYNFCAQTNCSDGSGPVGGVTLGTDGNFYGTTEYGGANEGGTIFKISPRGALTTLYNFCAQANCADGTYADSALMQATDGNWYGTTFGGGIVGCSNYGCGTIFRITPKGEFTSLYSFGDTGNPAAGLIQGRDGSLYGTTTGSGGGRGFGLIFKITLSGTLTTLNQLAGGDGADAYAGLLQGTDGNFYGTAAFGGSNDGTYCNGQGCGTVFKITPGGTLTTFYNFCNQTNCNDGAGPFSPLIQATDGKFYGTTSSGGTFGGGTIFSISSTGVLTTLQSFDGPDGAGADGGLLQDTNGTFYGTTTYGGTPDDGTAFSLDAGLHPFVTLVRSSGKIGADIQILGQGFTGTAAVSFNGVPAVYTVKSNTFLTAIVPSDATTGFVSVTTLGTTLRSDVPFRVMP